MRPASIATRASPTACPTCATYPAGKGLAERVRQYAIGSAEFIRTYRNSPDSYHPLWLIDPVIKTIKETPMRYSLLGLLMATSFIAHAEIQTREIPYTAADGTRMVGYYAY